MYKVIHKFQGDSIVIPFPNIEQAANEISAIHEEAREIGFTQGEDYEVILISEVA